MFFLRGPANHANLSHSPSAFLWSFLLAIVYREIERSLLVSQLHVSGGERTVMVQASLRFCLWGNLPGERIAI
jgi:hypothetical protein